MTHLVEKNFKEFGFKMYLIKGDSGISSQLSGAYAQREPEFIHLIHSNIKEGDICCDIGANIGYTVFHMIQAMHKNGTLYAFEPDTRNFDVLRKNIDLNGCNNITIAENIGISDSKKEMVFYTSKQSNLGSMTKTKNSDGSVVVPVNSIDNYFYEAKNVPSFYKMDVEGHEVQILRGMRSTLKRSSSGTKILMEIHQFLYDRGEFRKEIEFLLDNDFYVKNLASAGVSRPQIMIERGYSPYQEFMCGKRHRRGVYKDLKDSDALDFCDFVFYSEEKKRYDRIIRSILIEKK